MYQVVLGRVVLGQSIRCREVGDFCHKKRLKKSKVLFQGNIRAVVADFVIHVL